MTKQYEQQVIRKLVDSNTDKSDNHRGCHMVGDVTKCVGISCSQCPFMLSSRGATMGDVRRMDTRPKVGVPEAVEPKVSEPKVTGGNTGANPDVVQPGHYMLFEGVESIQVIARSMTVEQFKGFCMGNTLKYRLRAGKKSDQANVTKDLAKAEFYKELFEKHKGECYVAK